MKLQSIKNNLSLLALVLVVLSALSFAESPGQRGRAPTPHISPPRQSAPVYHAQREPVRTRNFVRPPAYSPLRPSPTAHPTQMPRQTASETLRLPVVRSNDNIPHINNPWQTHLQPTGAVRDARSFTRTSEGRQYDNGVRLRKGRRVTSPLEQPYFSNGYSYYPYYWYSNNQGIGYISPYAYYWGLCSPWINAGFTFPFPPAIPFIDLPVYSGNEFTGWSPDPEDNWLDHSDLEQTNPGLSNAIDEINEAFGSANIDALVSLIDPNVQIAIYERGKYQYSLPANDYVDLTRDALNGIHTVKLTLNRVHQKAPNVFSVSGQHEYKDATGADLTNYLTFVLQDFSGQWTLTQVDVSPDVARTLELKG